MSENIFNLPSGKVQNETKDVLQQIANTLDTSIDAVNRMSDVEQLVSSVIDGEIQGVLNNELVATDIANKLNAKEAEYAPKLTEVTTQLAQTDGKTKENKVRMNTETISRRHRKPMITIIDDDGKSEVISRWEPILSEKEFQLSLAVITGSVGNSGYCTWEELEHYKTNYNVELVNHTHTHLRMAELTEEEVIYQFEESTKILKERGHESDIMVYPYGSHNEIVRDVSRRYSRASFDIPNGLNVPPLSTHALNRVTLMPMSGEMETLSYYTDWIDSAIQENAWLVFMAHCHYDSFDIDKIKQIIDYANSKEIEWVTTQEGLDKIGNIIDTGDFAGRARGAEHTVLDADGILHSRANSKDYHYKRPSDFKPIFSTPLTEYPEGHSVAHVQMVDSEGFPKEYGGLVETFRGGAQGSSDTYNYQLYHPINSNQTYKRTWHRTQENWHTFELIPSQSDIDNQISHLVKKINFYDANTPITEYPDNKVTTFAVNSQNAEGFPETSAGIVTTYKIHLQNWNRQEFRKYRSNELWSRWADGDGVWQSWEKISAV